MVWFQQWSGQVRGVMLGVALLALAGMIVGCGSSGKSAKGPTPSEEREVEEYEAETAEEATDPTIPRNLNEMIVKKPTNEEATTAQLSRQIISNEESSDPTHEQKASCSWLSEYGHYTHYMCMGYAVGGTNSALGQIEVTVDDRTGEVIVEGGE